MEEENNQRDVLMGVHFGVREKPNMSGKLPGIQEDDPS